MKEGTLIKLISVLGWGSEDHGNLSLLEKEGIGNETKSFKT